MKKILVSIPFVILIMLIVQSITTQGELILGALGILKFEFIDPSYELFFAICTYTGPLTLAAYVYARVASRSGVRFDLLAYWTLTVFCGLLGLLGLLTFYYLANANLPPTLRLETPLILLVLACIRIFGLVANPREKKISENGKNNEVEQESK